MQHILRDFQETMDQQIDEGFGKGYRHILCVAPTGSGKTVLMGHQIKKFNTPSVAIAHRQELVGQIALALNRERILHSLAASDKVIRQIVRLEQENHGRSYFVPSAPTKVASVDTLIRMDPNDPWVRSVGLVLHDEAHHRLADNKWGRAQLPFVNARSLGFTAHAIRADRKGLGTKTLGGVGVVDYMVLGPSARELIDRGFLCDYRLIVPPSDIHTEDIEVSEATGDYNPTAVRVAVHESKTIVGDVVSHYLKWAKGKLGITFAVDIESASEIAARYNAAGVPAEIITGKTPIDVRGKLMRDFRARRLLQLVSVDVLGEGVDVPAVEVVSMARPTASFQLYAQQFGRALRLFLSEHHQARWNDYTDAERLYYISTSAKPRAIIIDHVNNYQMHGLPDVKKQYSLASITKRQKKLDDLPLRYCINEDCYAAYYAYLSKCPVCGTPKPLPESRGSIEAVDGNCEELDQAELIEMRKAQAKVDGPAPTHFNPAIRGKLYKDHERRQEAQKYLRHTMAHWGGWQQHQGLTPGETMTKFYMRFGVDVKSAQVLGAIDAIALEQRIKAELDSNGITELKN